MSFQYPFKIVPYLDLNEKCKSFVLNLKEGEEYTLDSLAKTLSEGLFSLEEKFKEYEKLRRLYIWIKWNIAYDIEYLFFLLGVEGFPKKESPKTDPKEVIKTRSSVCLGYAKFLVDVGTRMGLNVQVVGGVTKGKYYNPVKRQEPHELVGHEWVGVRLLVADGFFYTIDPTFDSYDFQQCLQLKKFIRRSIDFDLCFLSPPFTFMSLKNYPQYNLEFVPIDPTKGGEEKLGFQDWHKLNIFSPFYFLSSNLVILKEPNFVIENVIQKHSFYTKLKNPDLSTVVPTGFRIRARKFEKPDPSRIHMERVDYDEEYEGRKVSEDSFKKYEDDQNIWEISIAFFFEGWFEVELEACYDENKKEFCSLAKYYIFCKEKFSL